MPEAYLVRKDSRTQVQTLTKPGVVLFSLGWRTPGRRGTASCHPKASHRLLLHVPRPRRARGRRAVSAAFGSAPRKAGGFVRPAASHRSLHYAPRLSLAGRRVAARSSPPGEVPAGGAGPPAGSLRGRERVPRGRGRGRSKECEECAECVECGACKGAVFCTRPKG